MVDKSPVPSRGVQTSFNRPEDPGKGNEQKRDRINAAFEPFQLTGGTLNGLGEWNSGVRRSAMK